VSDLLICFKPAKSSAKALSTSRLPQDRGHCPQSRYVPLNLHSDHSKSSFSQRKFALYLAMLSLNNPYFRAIKSSKKTDCAQITLGIPFFFLISLELWWQACTYKHIFDNFYCYGRANCVLDSNLWRLGFLSCSSSLMAKKKDKPILMVDISKSFCNVVMFYSAAQQSWVKTQ
jgi:hypothetical protein